MRVVLLIVVLALGLLVVGRQLLGPGAAAAGEPGDGPAPSPVAASGQLAPPPAELRGGTAAGELDGPAPELAGSPGTGEAGRLNGRAGEALRQGRPAEAVQLLQAARLRAPDDEVLLRNLAFAHYKTGEQLLQQQHTVEASAAFGRAWDLDDAESAYGLHAASLALRSFDLQAALVLLGQILALHPESGNALLMKGDVLNLLDRPEEALAAYDAALERADGQLAAAARTGRERTARQLAVERDYVSEETAYFVVRHPRASDHLRLLGLLERARVEVCQALGVFPDHKALVVLYPPQAFREATGTHDWVGGLFDRKIRLPIADPDRQTEAFEAAFRHEFTHLMVSEWNPRCATFVNEGLAQMMEFGRGRGLDRLVDYLDSRGLSREAPPRLAELPDSFVGLADRQAVGLGYMLSYAFVDHVAERHGMAALVRWIRDLEQAPLDEAYRAAAGRTLEREEAIFRELLRTAR